MIELSLFYNHAAFGDTIILIGDESAVPDLVEMHGSIAVLKEGERVVGLNIFHSNDYVKIHARGLVHSLNSLLAHVIETIVSDETGYQVQLVESVFYRARVESRSGEFYLLDIGKSDLVKALSLSPSIEIGEYVEVAESQTRIATGHKAYHYLKNKADYLITNSSLTSGECGSRLYQVK